MYPCSTCVSKNPTAPVFLDGSKIPALQTPSDGLQEIRGHAVCAPSNLVQGRMSKHSKQQVVKRIGIMQEFVPVSRAFKCYCYCFFQTLRCGMFWSE